MPEKSVIICSALLYIAFCQNATATVAIVQRNRGVVFIFDIFARAKGVAGYAIMTVQKGQCLKMGKSAIGVK